MKTLYKNKIFELKEDEKTGYGLIKHEPVVAVLAWLNEDTILLCKQYRLAVDDTILEIPAGHIDKDELSEKAARRELLEETGYEAETMEFVDSFYSSPGYSNEEITLYEAKGLTYKGQQLDGDEKIEVIAKRVDQILRPLNDDGSLNSAMDMKTYLAVVYALNMRAFGQADRWMKMLDKRGE